MNDKAYQNKIKQEELDYFESLQDYHNNLEEFYLTQLQKYILNKEKYKVLNSIKELDFSQIKENNCFWLQTNIKKEGQSYITLFKHINCFGIQKEIKLNNIRYQENKVRGSSLSLRIVKFNSKEQKEQFSLFHFFSQKSQQKSTLEKAIKLQKNIQNQNFITPEQSESSYENEDITQEEEDIQSVERQMTPQFFNQHQMEGEDIEFYDSTTATFDSSSKKRQNASKKRENQKLQKQNINQEEQKQRKNLINNKNNEQLNNSVDIIMIQDDNDLNKQNEKQQQNKNNLKLSYNSKGDKNQIQLNGEQNNTFVQAPKLCKINHIEKQFKDQDMRSTFQQNIIQQNIKNSTTNYSKNHNSEPTFIIIND
ncbi:hypothetical protein ABPG74_004778 [Tetrahymena malaccensis]